MYIYIYVHIFFVLFLMVCFIASNQELPTVRGCTLAGDFNFCLRCRKSAIFGVWVAPGGPGDPPETWGPSPPTFLKGFPGPRGRPDRQNDRFPILNCVF